MNTRYCMCWSLLIVATVLLLWYRIVYEDRVVERLTISEVTEDLFVNTSVPMLEVVIVNQSAPVPEVPSMKFILVWTDPYKYPIVKLGNGTKSFVSRKCLYTNCYVSSNRKFFDDIRKYDVVVFRAKELAKYPKRWLEDLPRVRAPHQKYVFASTESSDYYPICAKQYNGFFNCTWTYKLNSDEMNGYIVVRNKAGEIVGPRSVMHWERMDTMAPIDDKLKAKLNTKTLAAAWFVSNCNALNGRLEFAKQLNTELIKYNLTLDIYGACGTKRCPSRNMEYCLQLVERDYFFYLSFENSFSEDYVTEKLLTALQHYAVPIVYGDANYTRFMPDGIYLDARKLGVQKLALRMANIIYNKKMYYDFFKWHNYYSYHDVEESPETDSYCGLCSFINKNERSVNSSYKDLIGWWNKRGRCM